MKKCFHICRNCGQFHTELMHGGDLAKPIEYYSCRLEYSMNNLAGFKALIKEPFNESEVPPLCWRIEKLKVVSKLKNI